NKELGLEIIGESFTTETNYNRKQIQNYEEAYEFATKAGFPEHGMVISIGETPHDEDIFKGIQTETHLKEAVKLAISKSPAKNVYIETDMRAMYNPTRMENIKRATEDLIQNIKRCCPKCDWPGFKLIEKKRGLPCSWCGSPTNQILHLTYKCLKCSHVEEIPNPDGEQKADPRHCPSCNP
ncbi:DUF6671 family protein, partial [Caldalkalibacillus thermarum]